MNQIILKVRSRKLTQLNEVCILIPEGDYSVRREYPVLWLLHGGSWDYTCFLYHDRIEEILKGRKYVVVMPSGLNSDFANHMEFASGYPVTDYFFDELMPLVYRTFPASKRKEDNYLAGYSMGGAAALMFALLHPEKFALTGVLGSTVRESAFLEPYRKLKGWEFRAEAVKNPKAFPTEFGDPDKGITRKEINMIARYDSVEDYLDSPECTIERFNDAVKEGRVPELLFCSGEEDGCTPKVRAFLDYAEKAGVKSIRSCFIPGCTHDMSDIVLRYALKEMGLTN